MEDERVDVLGRQGSFKSGDIRVLDFQDLIDAFKPEDFESDKLEAEEEEVVESFFGVEGLDEDLDTFYEESERAGLSNPILYVPDRYYDNLPEDEEGKVDVGALDRTVPVKILPIEDDLFSRLKRFSFGEDMEQLLEGEEESAVLVNPSGERTYEGETRLEVGEQVAEIAYEKVMNKRDESNLEYLQDQRGIGVMQIDNGRFEIEIDETVVGREVDYQLDEDEEVLVLELGDETVELDYGELEHGSMDAYDSGVLDPRLNEDAQVYKFIIEE